MLMKRTHLLLTLVTLLVAGTASAQGPNNSGTYYQDANGKKGAELKTALCGIIKANHVSLDYGSLWGHYETTDKRSDGKVWDMYSNKSNFTYGSTDQDSGSGGSTEGDKFNREHSFPNSWFGGIKNSIMYSDLFHLYPTDKLVNNKRSNHPFGETNGSWKSNDDFCKLGSCTYTGYSGTVFEPNDIYKGDFARTYFYMVTRYEDEIPSWYTDYGVNSGKGEETSKAVKATLDGNKYPGFQEWQLNMLLEWATNDPVDKPIEKETPRNNAVYGIQGNRNPFIDYPGLEQYIWGTLKEVAFSYDNYQQPAAVMTVKTEAKAHDNVMYNMSGQVVDKSYKGMVIMNGKKFWNK